MKRHEKKPPSTSTYIYMQQLEMKITSNCTHKNANEKKSGKPLTFLYFEDECILHVLFKSLDQ
jgi:hypothetical protein